MLMMERDLEAVLFDYPRLIPPLFGTGSYACPAVSSWVARQYTVPSGRIDLLGVREYPPYRTLVVVELKRGEIDARSLTQVCRYAADIENILAHITHTNGVMPVGDSRVNKIVIGSRIAHQQYIAAEGMGVSVYSYCVERDRLEISPIIFEDSWRWVAYERIAEDSIFDYWAKKARQEAAQLSREVRGAR